MPRILVEEDRFLGLARSPTPDLYVWIT